MKDRCLSVKEFRTTQCPPLNTCLHQLFHCGVPGLSHATLHAVHRPSPPLKCTKIYFFTRNTHRLNVRHWPPAKPSAVPHAGADSSCDSFFSEEGGAPDRPSNSEAGGGEAETQAPRAVILAGSLSELPRSMRLGGAVVFTNLSSPEAWR